MIYAIVGLIVGLIVGNFFSFLMPLHFAKYMAVAILASFDTVFGGMRAGLDNKFDTMIFISGFFTNTLLAVILVYIGEHLDINIYMVALIVFGLRMFNNLAVIRYHFIKNKKIWKKF